MTHSGKPHSGKSQFRGKHPQSPPSKKGTLLLGICIGSLLAILGVVLVASGFFNDPPTTQQQSTAAPQAAENNRPRYRPTELWLQRAYFVDRLFHEVYTPGWEGAYGALGDAYLFAATGDSALLRFHLVEHPLTRLMNGNWLDDRAWACLAELTWWEVTGRTNMQLVTDAAQRYDEARASGMLSNHEGYWTWYNYPPGARVSDPVFTNTNMNQMANVACRLYVATREERFLKDALLVWNGDAGSPGVERRLYRGDGRWQGREGRAAFGKELPWNGTGYCSIGAALYRVTGDSRYKQIAVATARRILDPGNGWVDPIDYFQIRMDGNGAFVHFLMDAYSIAPGELPAVPEKVATMLEHVWTNHHGNARVVLHRESDHGIRNGWNPEGGEDGYGVDEVGTVHAQGEAARAFGTFVYFRNVSSPAPDSPRPR